MRRLPCKAAAEAAILVLAAVTSVGGAHCQEQTGPPASSGQISNADGRDLQLNVFINESAVNLIGSFKQVTDHSLAATAEELKEIGLLAKNAPGPDGLVRLNHLPGVSYRVDEAAQAIHITAADESRAPHIVDLRPQSGPIPPPQRSYGGVLNYTLFASSDGAFWRDLKTFQGLSGAFDGRVFGPFGTFSQSLIASTASPELGGLTRLDSTWAYSNVDELITYRAGDTISGGLSWTRPVRLGGVQMQRSFALRPDLVTMPIPSLSGPAGRCRHTENARGCCPSRSQRCRRGFRHL